MYKPHHKMGGVQRQEGPADPVASPGKRTLVEALQRHDAPGGTKPGGETLIEALQRRAAASGATPGGETLVHGAAARGTEGPGEQLPFRDEIQRLFGHHDVGQIRAHTDGAAADAAREIGATAYATGNHVAFGGAPDLHTAAHEAAHVVQQRRGVHLKAGVGVEGDSYEQHANVVADRVVAGRSAEDQLDAFAGSGGGAAQGADLLGPGNRSAVEALPEGSVIQRKPGPTMDEPTSAQAVQGAATQPQDAGNVVQHGEGPSLEPETGELDAEERELQEHHRDRIESEGDRVTTTRQTSLGGKLRPSNETSGGKLRALAAERREILARGAEGNRRLGDRGKLKSLGNKIDRGARSERGLFAPMLKDEEVREALDRARFPVDSPHELDMSNRLPHGPMFNPLELAAVRKLSETEHGRAWLNLASVFSMDRARDYLLQKQYQDWLALAPANRLLLASLAWERGLKSFPPTPAYSLARHIVLGRDDLPPDERSQIETEHDDDIRQTWVDTLSDTKLNDPARQAIQSGAVTTVPRGKTGAIAKAVGLSRPAVRNNPEEIQDENAKAVEIVKRVFLLLQAGLKVYRKDAQGHVDFHDGDVARALAHGGRVNIHIPPLTDGQTGEELPEWLGIRRGGHASGNHVFGRGFGTHDVEVRKGAGGNEEMIESGGVGANLKHMRTKSLYGMNIAVGGLGRRDVNGDVILPDGAHGHMFISFIPPVAERGGSLQIGMETTGPGAPSTVGYKHTAKSTEATANPESSSYGHKSDKIGEGAPAPLNKFGRHKETVTDWKATVPQYVDLAQINGGQWRDYVEELRTGWLEPMLVGNPQTQRQTFEKLVGRRGIPLYEKDRGTGGNRKIVGYERRDLLSDEEQDERDSAWTRVNVSETGQHLWARTDDLRRSA